MKAFPQLCRRLRELASTTSNQKEGAYVDRQLALSCPYRFVMLNTGAESPGCAKGTTVSGANHTMALPE